MIVCNGGAVSAMVIADEKADSYRAQVYEIQDSVSAFADRLLFFGMKHLKKTIFVLTINYSCDIMLNAFKYISTDD